MCRICVHAKNRSEAGPNGVTKINLKRNEGCYIFIFVLNKKDRPNGQAKL